MKKGILYKIINLIVIVAAAAFFVYEYKGYKSIQDLFGPEYLKVIGIIIVAVLLVHAIKLFRLYLTLYGEDITFVECAKTYCKVTPVSMIFPFKIGELFRMYCYSVAISKKLKGIVVILLDRFMDTLALVVTIVIMLVFKSEKVPTMVYLLLLFLVILLVAFIVFPKMHKVWKQYILKEKATENKIRFLHFLDFCKRIYLEIAELVKSRGIILFVLSMIAWGIEIGCATILIKMFSTGKKSSISEYLTSALSGNQTTELKEFVVVSVAVLIIGYIVMKLCSLVWRNKK